MHRKFSANLEKLLCSSPIQAAFLTDALAENPVLHLYQQNGQRINLSVVTDADGALRFSAYKGDDHQDPYQPEEKF